MGRVMIIVGSEEDCGRMEPAIWPLVENGVDVEMHAMPRHYTAKELEHTVDNTDANIFIVGAKIVAALPGAVAALTMKPVIDVPLSGASLSGIGGLFVTANMPRCIPDITVGLNDAKAAAYLALDLLRNRDIEVSNNIAYGCPIGAFI